jgi:L-glutamine-phosphate cytidylyltransferase
MNAHHMQRDDRFGARANMNASGVDRAVIIAAGMGNRLLPHTADRPKCMLDVAGRAILDWQLEAMRQTGIHDVAVIRGYQGKAIARPDLQFFDNLDYERNNILGSLFCAESAFERGALISYSDILYTPAVVAAAVASDADIAIVVDTAWRDGYVGRVGHPLEEAELVRVSDGRVVDAGKGIDFDDAYGEFIGMLKVTAAGATAIRRCYHEARMHYAGRRFQKASTFEKAYLTDLFSELSQQGVMVTPVAIKGGWMEIDVEGDLARARRTWITENSREGYL